MPLTEKGKKIMKSMQKQYGKKKAEEVFYASKNAGKITGVEKTMKAKKGKIIKANEGKFSEKFEMPNYEYERRKGSPEILIPKGPKFERDADDPKRMERFREERPIGKLPKSRQKEIEDILKRTPKDPKPPKQKIEFDEAKKGKMMKASMGALIGFGADKLLKKSESARKLASNLGLSGMALSKYYSNKEELLEYIRSRRVVNEYGEELNPDEFIEMALNWGKAEGLSVDEQYVINHGYSFTHIDKEIDGLRVSSSTEFS